VDANVACKSVRASRGKVTRAEPVAALYEQGRVHDVGVFADLETQMTTWSPPDDRDSPDRVDPLVWGLSELMLTNRQWTIDEIMAWGATISTRCGQWSRAPTLHLRFPRTQADATFGAETALAGH
jgi:hypothetical protein